MSDELTSIIKKSFHEIERKNYKSAIEFLYPYLVDYPDNIEIITQIAQCYEKMGEKEQAVEYYEKAFDLNNFSTLILDPLIELKIEQDKYNEAMNYAKYYLECENKIYAMQKYLETLSEIKQYELIENFAQTVNENYLNSISYAIIANSIIENLSNKENKEEEIQKAINYAQKGLSMDKNNLDAACAIAKCCIENNEPEKIEELYKNTPNASQSSMFMSIYGYKKFITEDYASAVDCYTRALELDKSNEILYHNLAESYMRQGWFKEAEVIIKRGLALNENNITLRLSLANIYYSNKEYDKTLLTLSFINELDPDNVEMNLLYAYTYANQNNFAKANEYAKKLEGKIDSGYIDNSFGKIYYNLGQKEKAFEMFDKAIEKEPENIQFLTDKADYLLYENEYEEAQKIYDKIIEVNPNYVDAYYSKAKIFEYLNNYENAFKFAKIAVEKDCNNADYQYLFSEIYAYLKEYDKAIDCLKFAISITPDDIEKYNALGYLYLEKGDVESAISYYKEVLAINPNDFDILIKIARALASYNNVEKAYEYYLKAYRANPYDYDFINEYSNFVIQNISVYKGITLLLNFAKYSSNKNIAEEVKNRIKFIKKENNSKLTLKEKLKLMFK